MAHQPFHDVVCALAHKDATWKCCAKHKEGIKKGWRPSRHGWPSQAIEFSEQR